MAELNLGELKLTPKTGNEELSLSGKTLLDFWRWQGSDLASNATRGVLAEFIVAVAIGADLSKPRREWSAWDLTSPEGIKIEVKSAAYLQSWTQRKLSDIVFSIRPARPWSGVTGKMAEQPQRLADVYVFCLLKHTDKETLNPLDLRQWDFYVLSVTDVNNYQRSKTSITLASLEKIAPAIPFEKLHDHIISKSDKK
jgi:hypothetical protein